MSVFVSSSTHATEDEEIEEVHYSKNDEDHADFYGQCLDSFFRIGDCVAKFQRHAHVTEVDEIEADDEEVID